MSTSLLPLHGGLSSASRLAALSPACRPRAEAGPLASVAEILVLLLLGVGAALLVVLLDFSLKLPGHAILRSVLPMALGLALVPRRLAGTIMGTGALATALCFAFGGLGMKGMGSLTSLCLTGPLLDAALWTARGGWRLYLGFVVAGLASNLAAFFLQAMLKSYGLGGGGGKSLAQWLPLAAATYPTFGIAAALISAALWFQFRTPSAAPPGSRKSP